MFGPDAPGLIQSHFANMPIERDRHDLLLAVKQTFQWSLLCYGWADRPHRNDVTFHGWHADYRVNETEPTDQLRLDVRHYVNGRNWQFSRNPYRPDFMPGRVIEYVHLAPMRPVALGICYHATRRSSVDGILRMGLLPSIPDRQTTEGRWDCEGNIYVCEQLGQPTDAGAVGGTPGAGTAHWWRDHLAKNNRFTIPDWVILELDLTDLPGMRTTRDIWSASGVVIDNLASIPGDRVRRLIER